MSSQIQSNENSPELKEPKTHKENQVNEDIRPINPFNFIEEIKDSSEMERRGSQYDNQQKELWRWHLKLNHLSYPKIKLMASQGKLPKRLVAMDVPVCPACAYSKATRKPWRYKKVTIKSRKLLCQGNVYQ
jgi:hypothetical protein